MVKTVHLHLLFSLLYIILRNISVKWCISSAFITHESCWFRTNGSIAYVEYEMDIITMGLLFQISLLLKHPNPYQPLLFLLLVSFKSYQMCMHIIEIGVCMYTISYIPSISMFHATVLFNCHRNSEAASTIRIECKYIYLFMKRFGIS